MRKKKPSSLKKTINSKKPNRSKKRNRGKVEKGKPSARIHQGVGPETVGQSGTTHETPEGDIPPEHEAES